jgi:hypothetical protein
MFFNEVVLKVEEAIKKLRTKFLESPYTFYTESDIHCYLYHLLYQKKVFKEPAKVLVRRKPILTIRLHKEYPTLGKFYKAPRKRVLIPHNKKEPYITIEGKTLQPSRGSYDMAIIDPDEKQDFKWQKTSIAIELALNEIHPSLWHLQNDYTKIAFDVDKVERGYILFFIRKADLSDYLIRKRLPQIRANLRTDYEQSLNPNVRILYLESPKTEEESEIHLPSEWNIETD